MPPSYVSPEAAYVTRDNIVLPPELSQEDADYVEEVGRLQVADEVPGLAYDGDVPPREDEEERAREEDREPQSPATPTLQERLEHQEFRVAELHAQRQPSQLSEEQVEARDREVEEAQE